MKQKRTILTQEVLRVLLNCSVCIPWEEVAKHVSNMVLQMQFSGFPKKFRYEIVNSALKAYDEIHRRVELGERPLYHPFEWNREERDRAKKNRVLNWYKNGKYDSVIFIQSTPGSELKSKYQNEIDRCGVRIRVVEKAGRSLKSRLQRSDPFKEASCNCETCLIGGRGSCSKDGINYEIACVGCEQQGRDVKYHGESSKNGYTHGKQHLEELAVQNRAKSLSKAINQKVASIEKLLKPYNRKTVYIAKYVPSLRNMKIDQIEAFNIDSEIYHNSDMLNTMEPGDSVPTRYPPKRCSKFVTLHADALSLLEKPNFFPDNLKLNIDEIREIVRSTNAKNGGEDTNLQSSLNEIDELVDDTDDDIRVVHKLRIWRLCENKAFWV
eukprot:gene13424-14803_t